MQRWLFPVGTLVTVVAVVACSSSPGATDTSPSGVKGAPTPARDAAADAPPSTSADASSSSSTDDPPEDCRTEQYQEDCVACVYVQSGDASAKDDQLYNDCICANTACGTQCAQSYCSTATDAPDVQPNDPCDVCLTAHDKECSATADTKCAGDPTCAPYISALNAAGCSKKPNAPADDDAGADGGKN